MTLLPTSSHDALQQKKQRIIRHTAFWLLYALLFTSTQGSFYAMFFHNSGFAYLHAFIEMLLLLPFQLVAVYLSLFFLFAQYNKTYQLLLRSVLSLVSISALTLLHRSFFLWALDTSRFSDMSVGHAFFSADFLLRNFIHICFVVIVAGALKSLLNHYRVQQKTSDISHRRVEAELKLLKAHLHPHFLFNTLNNLYALTLQKSDNAPDVVMKLSELLNFILYEAVSETVPLENNVSFLRNYVDLEKLRYNNRLTLEFNITGNTENKRIVPLIILPFIENSFKHGVSGEVGKSWIKININIEDKYINFSVENSKDSEKVRDETGYTQGVGLKNVKKRLELLYPDAYTLHTFDQGNSFLVELRMPIHHDDEMETLIK